MTTQDGYDWPNGVGDERWPEPHDRGAVSSHLREQLQRSEKMVTVNTGCSEPRCVLKVCVCARYGTTGQPVRNCIHWGHGVPA